MKIYIPILIVVASLGLFSAAHAATNISSSTTQHWGWNDSIGWLDFYNTNTVTVASSSLSGYASSSVGVISLDCHTTPPGSANICSAGNGNYQVFNDGAGNLSGWAWNDTIGWVSFCGSACGVGTVPYRVTIDSGGNFRGWAWNDLAGWITFNCLDVGGSAYCSGTSNFEVLTSWTATSTSGMLDSAIFDTGDVLGAQLNSVMWLGNLPGDISPNNGVAFQLAVATSSAGPWNFVGPGGSTSTYDVWIGGNPGMQVPLTTYAFYQNFRYFRYRIILTSNPSHTTTPRVDDVIVSWSP
jgi:hypothetical protein